MNDTIQTQIQSKTKLDLPPQPKKRLPNPFVYARPAFAASETRGGNWSFQNKDQEGVTLRDHYAGLAMQAYIINQQARGGTQRDIAGAAFNMADAMLEARMENQP
jgi:hypothetical protein